uniref:Uncharacterized protein n=1 Tax=Opuntia streptacantha TaxID=393608 RepID=A0A7C9E0A1_OPUST
MAKMKNKKEEWYFSLPYRLDSSEASGCLEFVDLELPILTHLHIAGHFSHWTVSSAVLRRRPPPLRSYPSLASTVALVPFVPSSVSFSPRYCCSAAGDGRCRHHPGPVPSLHCHLLPSGLGSLLCRKGWSSE